MNAAGDHGQHRGGTTADPRAPLGRLARRALVLGACGVAAAVLLALLGVGDFWRPYLFAFQLCLGLGLGGAAILMLHHLSGGRWGSCVRRPLEALAATVPLLVLMFVPIALVPERLYPWLGPDAHELVRGKAAYLDRGFFLLRAACFAFVWCLFAFLLAWRRPPGAGTGQSPRLLGGVAAVGLVLHVLTVGFSAIDWVGSLEPLWSSSGLGFNLVAAQALGAMALVVAIACGAALALDAWPTAVRDRLHDLGNLLLMLVAFDAYLAFMQYFITWNGNLPHHVLWYVPRTRGLWGAVGMAMIVLQFALPLAALLFRAVKRNPRALLAVALVVLVGRVVDSAWLVLPGAPDAGPLDLLVAAAAAVGLGGLGAAVFLWQCGRRLEAA